VFLPIHAAGLYGMAVSGSKVSNFVVSSYTLTLSALVDSHQPVAPQQFQLLVIADPSASPSWGKEELDLTQHTGNFTAFLLMQSKAMVEGVMQGMQKSSWVHFACYRQKHLVEVGLVLAADQCLKLSDIIKMSLPHAEFAYLSASSNAKEVRDLSGEGVHLAAGMLLAGYRGMIAMMWRISVRDAHRIADGVYAHLFKDQQPDHTQAAHALHYAVQQFCEESGGKSFVPFIHMGV
jgi:CHAT domain-containing protein